MNQRDINVKYHKSLYISQSAISGYGLYAGEKITEGEIILSFGGTLAYQSERYSGKYMSSTFVGLSEDIMLCETTSAEKDYSDYINHSCNPNAGMLDCLTVIAIKNIDINEEIFCDYAFWEADEEWLLEVQCKCGSVNCRKIITGRDWQKVSPTSKNYQYFSPFIKRRILNHGKKA